VGAGPAGLTAAFYLRKQGHSVTIFEAQSKLGGMMRYGIPVYRLPHDILDKEIEEILSLGIEFTSNQRLGVDFTLDDLKQRGYDTVFLAVGAPSSQRIAIDGSDLPDVLWSIDFLKQIAEETHAHLKDKVVVIGGGDVAVDVAQSAMRCGAKDVTMVCLESREEMPAHEWEIESALAEGVKLIPSWGPYKILSRNGQIHSVELIHCTSVIDEQGNFSPTYADTYETIEAAQVIMAVGQTTDLSFLKDGSSVSVKNGLLVVDQNTLETGSTGVYAGGDVTDKAGDIVNAIAAGRKAASSIDKTLGGSGEVEEILFPRNTPAHYLGHDEGFASWPREKIPELEIETRKQGFSEVSLGYKNEQAVREAKRCLQCDLRLYMRCNPAPPVKWLTLSEENVRKVPETEGVFQLFDNDNHVLAIKGTANLQELLLKDAIENEQATRFQFEENKMFSQRESELIQQYLRKHGEMPGGGDSELDDLF
jgi:NADPH-dependent glutamate synthase beta subunit-like oxidoreductase